MPSSRVTLVYNGDQLRMVKDTATSTANFIYDSQNILLQTDGTNLTQAVNTLEPKKFGNLISQRQLQSGLWVPVNYHYDGLGSTDSLTDGSAVITDTYTYFAFGRIKANTGSTENPFTWVGEQLYVLDSETGEVQTHRRQVDPDEGRFKSEDPIGFRAGDADLYRYVRNNPINATDPSGLAASCCPTTEDVAKLVGKTQDAFTSGDKGKKPAASQPATYAAPSLTEIPGAAWDCAVSLGKSGLQLARTRCHPTPGGCLGILGKMLSATWRSLDRFL
jgi:RHS repeat-associated protein